MSNFRPEELVKVQGKEYPVVGGRLRLAHENKNISIETSIYQYTSELAVVQATVTTEKGKFSGLGNASITRDKRLHDAILELAETRAIARALRFAGYGVEYTGYEEMPADDEKPQPEKTHLMTHVQNKDIAKFAKENKLTQEDLQIIAHMVIKKNISPRCTEEEANKFLEACFTGEALEKLKAYKKKEFAGTPL